MLEHTVRLVVFAIARTRRPVCRTAEVVEPAGAAVDVAERIALTNGYVHRIPFPGQG